MMTEDQYRFLVESYVPDDEVEYFMLGMSCYEDGYMDNFGFLTPKANKAIVEYDVIKKGMGQPLQTDSPVKADSNPARERD